eukprot:TRINITY_DN66657_c7_g1_i3.p1 TRINITY_DN66657_c7_g1~~TRINITY_DN66657_c7_g1_i3.p1  ORF type:complete len:131 (-),score=2.50 TRINITY_DN66657_c7_g1_i3:328-720(-)
MASTRVCCFFICLHENCEVGFLKLVAQKLELLGAGSQWCLECCTLERGMVVRGGSRQFAPPLSLSRVEGTPNATLTIAVTPYRLLSKADVGLKIQGGCCFLHLLVLLAQHCCPAQVVVLGWRCTERADKL